MDSYRRRNVNNKYLKSEIIHVYRYISTNCIYVWKRVQQLTITRKSYNYGDDFVYIYF